MMNEQGRKIRSDKKIRVNPALDRETHEKLQRLALACDTNKTELAAEIIGVALNTANFINYLQDRHHADTFRVIPLTENGKVTF